MSRLKTGRGARGGAVAAWRGRDGGSDPGWAGGAGGEETWGLRQPQPRTMPRSGSLEETQYQNLITNM